MNTACGWVDERGTVRIVMTRSHRDGEKKKNTGPTQPTFFDSDSSSFSGSNATLGFGASNAIPLDKSSPPEGPAAVVAVAVATTPSTSFSPDSSDEPSPSSPPEASPDAAAAASRECHRARRGIIVDVIGPVAAAAAANAAAVAAASVVCKHDDDDDDLDVAPGEQRT